MTRLFGILTLLTVFCVGAVAQQQEGGKSGSKQVTVILGQNPMFNQGTSYLLPDYSKETTGIAQSDPGFYLNLGEVGSNSLVNMVGVQANYFILDFLDVNASFAMNINMTPEKNFVEAAEGYYGEALSPSQKYIQGKMTTNWYATIGANYRFSLSNKHLSPYGGVRFGTQMGRIQTQLPYTGEKDDAGIEKLIYSRTSKAGQMYSLQGALVAGMDCVLNCGIVLGLEVSPFSYQHSVIMVDPAGTYRYACDHNSIKILSTPTLKFGFRF